MGLGDNTERISGTYYLAEKTKLEEFVEQLKGGEITLEDFVKQIICKEGQHMMNLWRKLCGKEDNTGRICGHTVIK
jgi:hypothetical protein